MIRQIDSFFLLDTRHTTYCFRAAERGFLPHLYYGRRLEPLYFECCSGGGNRTALALLFQPENRANAPVASRRTSGLPAAF